LRQSRKKPEEEGGERRRRGEGGPPGGRRRGEAERVVGWGHGLCRCPGNLVQDCSFVDQVGNKQGKKREGWALQ